MKSRTPWKHPFAFVLALLSILLSAISAQGQTTGFTYQGRLTDSGTAANGNYDLQFALWDSLSGGGQVGSTQTLNTVAVSNGVFTVTLDFGANAFPGANRFLEITARPSGSGTFTLLGPRQPITSTPYAVRSLNAATADNVPAATVINATTQYNLNGIRILSNPGTNNLFAGAGAGVANSTGSSNAFFGSSAGAANTTGFQNTFFGARAGQANTTGAANAFFGNGAGAANTSSDNAFFGNQAGAGNTSGFGNAFFGSSAGQANTTGTENSFFGRRAGESNTTGERNTFVGSSAGLMNTGSANDNTFIGFEAGKVNTANFNTFFGSKAGSVNTTATGNAFFGAVTGLDNSTGRDNSFFGFRAGIHTTTGSDNTFVGSSAGQSNQTGDFNTVIGALANLNANLTNATAIGACAYVSQSNSLVLGSTSSAPFTCSPAPDTNVGIGTTAPARLLHIKGPGSNGLGTGDLLITGSGAVGAAITFESTGSGGRKYSWISTSSSADSGAGKLAAFDVTAGAYRMVIDGSGRVGIGTSTPDATLSVSGTASKTGGGSWATFSDTRLKIIRGLFTPGLNAVLRLQPLRYEYKRDNALNLKSEGEHVGFSAQAVQKIIPEAVTSTEQGYLLINNDPILWTMLNAIKEQQAQIVRLQQANSTLKTRLHAIEKALRKNSSAPRRSRR